MSAPKHASEWPPLSVNAGQSRRSRGYAALCRRITCEMVCEQYEQLREVHTAAMREWSSAMTAPRWTKDAAQRLQDALEARDEAIGLLSQHRWTCLRCIGAMRA